MWNELPRIKIEKGIITLDVFERNNPHPVIHIKGNIKDKNIKKEIARVKEHYGSAFFSDILDFANISLSYSQIKEDLKEIERDG